MLRALALAAVLAAAPRASGIVDAESGPVRMTAKGGIEVDLERRVGVARTDVVISRDDVTVCCDVAEAEYSADQIRKVTCRGRVVVVRADGTKASADLAVFEAVRNAVTLEGRARVWTADARLSGPRIVYDIAADKLSVVGGASRFDFDPKGKAPPKDLRACPTPKP